MPKILVVDDDPDVTDAIELILGHSGFETMAAHTRFDGLAALASYSPDLVILDVMMEMPDDGIALAQEMRRKGLATPILMLTSISKVSGFRFARDEEVVPVDDFAEKPIEPAKLVEKVKALLRSKEDK